MSQVKEQNSKKRTNQNGDKQSTRCRVQNTGENLELKQHKKDMDIIKKNQSEIKDTLTEVKNNLQEINTTVDDAENKTSDL